MKKLACMLGRHNWRTGSPSYMVYENQLTSNYDYPHSIYICCKDCETTQLVFINYKANNDIIRKLIQQWADRLNELDKKKMNNDIEVEDNDYYVPAKKLYRENLESWEQIYLEDYTHASIAHENGLTLGIANQVSGYEWENITVEKIDKLIHHLQKIKELIK